MKLNAVLGGIAVIVCGLPIVATAQEDIWTMTSAEGSFSEATTGLTEIRIHSVMLFGPVGSWNGILESDTIIGGIPCLGGAGVRFQFGGMSACTTSTAWDYASVEVPPSSSLTLYADEPTATLFSVTPGAPMSVGEAVVAPDEVAVFHRSERVVQYIIVGSELSAPDGPVVCHTGHPEDRVLLHADRTIARCNLAEDYVTESGTIPISSVVAFDVSGELTQIMLRTDATYDGVEYASRTTLDISGRNRRVSSRSSDQIPEGTSTTDPFWRVSDGFYYGYPAHEVFPAE